ncbi:hypothetical protein CNX65_04830 [Actinosynnema pretiosum]|uniref:Phospholipase D-like domain-containing protein n=1 Tax=Actinosynnema pretiosum TaxID=42197 RepID=A0A290ZG51_9PSEU|nr:hypothetical protein CNX65_04830 [Actinosynnema pretiosum]
MSAGGILASALLSELAFPGPVIWLVSAWISDVEVLDNSQGGFDPLLGYEASGSLKLSDVLARLAESGSRIRVVTRPEPRNEGFVRQLQASTADQSRLTVDYDPLEHEKTLCGRNWMITGSMNFTKSGLGSNEESVRYVVDDSEVRQARLDFKSRWGA